MSYSLKSLHSSRSLRSEINGMPVPDSWKTWDFDSRTAELKKKLPKILEEFAHNHGLPYDAENPIRVLSNAFVHGRPHADRNKFFVSLESWDPQTASSQLIGTALGYGIAQCHDQFDAIPTLHTKIAEEQDLHRSITEIEFSSYKDALLAINALTNNPELKIHEPSLAK